MLLYIDSYECPIRGDIQTLSYMKSHYERHGSICTIAPEADKAAAAPNQTALEQWLLWKQFCRVFASPYAHEVCPNEQRIQSEAMAVCPACSIHWE